MSSADTDRAEKREKPVTGPDRPAANESAASELHDQDVVYVVGLWRRILAGVVDLLCLTPVLLLGGYLATRLAGVSVTTPQELRPETVLELFLKGGLAFYGVLGLLLALSMLYAFLFVATTGRTPGLKLLRGRVINVYGERPEWWRAFLRCWGFVLGLLFLGLGLLWIGFDRHKRGLHDWLSGTYVVRQQAGQRA